MRRYGGNGGGEDGEGGKGNGPAFEVKEGVGGEGGRGEGRGDGRRGEGSENERNRPHFSAPPYIFYDLISSLHGPFPILLSSPLLVHLLVSLMLLGLILKLLNNLTPVVDCSL